jgi:hypothetical protein
MHTHIQTYTGGGLGILQRRARKFRSKTYINTYIHTQIQRINTETKLIIHTYTHTQEVASASFNDEHASFKAFLVIESGVRIHTTRFSRENKDTPSNFAVKLRKHIRSQRLMAVEQLGVDRVLRLTFGKKDVSVCMYVCMYVWFYVAWRWLRAETYLWEERCFDMYVCTYVRMYMALYSVEQLGVDRVLRLAFGKKDVSVCMCVCMYVCMYVRLYSSL